MVILLSAALALDEMHTFAVEEFGPDPECCSTCGVTPWARDASERVYGVFLDFIADGDWDSARWSHDAAVDPEDWIDDDEETFGADAVDPWGVDSADVGFLFTHGGSDCWSDGTGHTFHVVMGAFNGNGEYADECKPESVEHFRFGDESEDLEIVVNGACHGADTCAWSNGAFTVDSAVTLHGTDLREYLGFHGVSYSAPGTPDEMEAYASTSLNNGIGSHWLSERLWLGILPDDDQCPVAITWGPTIADAVGFHTSGGFGDRTNPTPHAQKKRFVVAGCDPDEGGAM